MNNRFVRKKTDLSRNFKLTAEESSYWDLELKNSLPVTLNPYWAARCGDDPQDPLRKQYIPSAAEAITLDYETPDPIDDRKYSPLSRLIHRYHDRVLLLVTQRCALYCRHCFRRHFTGKDDSSISRKQIDDAVNYINNNRNIHEVILSGGDSLMLNIHKLTYLFEKLSEIKRPLLIRVGTRLPVSAPHLLTEPLLELLAAQSSLWMVMQVNHPNELSEEAVEKLKEINGKGIPMLNQSVLLKGINDDPEILKDLNYALLENRVKPYYLFQGDLAPGTSHFRVPLKRGLEIVRELRRRVSGMAMPLYAVDLPGGGKIPLQENRLIAKDDAYFYFENLEGQEFSYPVEGE